MARSQHPAASAAAHRITDAAPMPARVSSDRAKHLKLSARRTKERDKRVLGPALALALDLDGVSQTHLAIACGVDQPQVSRWHSQHETEAPTVLHVRLAAAAGLVHWARAASVRELPAVVDEPEADRLHRLTKELLDVPTIASKHLVGDGKRDGYERAQERRELLEALAVIEARLALLDSEDAAERGAR